MKNDMSVCVYKNNQSITVNCSVNQGFDLRPYTEVTLH